MNKPNSNNEAIAYVIGVLLIVLLWGGCVAYKMRLYKRKYPDTTTLDYFMDRRN